MAVSASSPLSSAPTVAELDFLESGSPGGDGGPFLTPRQLMWLRFKRNRMALWGAGLLLGLYLLTVFAPVVSPYMAQTRFPDHLYLPPRKIHFREAGGGVFRSPFVYAVKLEVDMESFRRVFVEDTAVSTPVRFWTKGDAYELWGFIPMDRHLLGIDQPGEYGPLFLLGGDKFGRDLLARILQGARISLTLGLAGVVIVLVIGLFLEGCPGFWAEW